MTRQVIPSRPLIVRDQACSLGASLVVHATILGMLAAVFLPVHGGASGHPGIAIAFADTVLADSPADANAVTIENVSFPESAAAGGSSGGRPDAPEFPQLAAQGPATVRLDAAMRANPDWNSAQWQGLNQPLGPAVGGSGGDGEGNGVGNGSGDGRGDMFFGIRHAQRRTLFVVDGSRSMNAPYPGEARTRFGRVKLELLRTISAMTEEQQFFMIFFSDLPVPMPASRMVEATGGAKDLHLTWMARLQADGQTEPEAALLLALSLRPDVIYFLTDGVFDYGVVRRVTAANTRHVPINSIGFGDESAEKPLRDIAEKNGGTYKFIPADNSAAPVQVDAPQSVSVSPAPVK